MKPLSIGKSLILRGGVNNICHVYMLESQSMPITDVFKDLGVLRLSHRHYNVHVASLSASCQRFVGMIRQVFRSRDADLLWTTFIAYAKHKVIFT